MNRIARDMQTEGRTYVSASRGHLAPGDPISNRSVVPVSLIRWEGAVVRLASRYGCHDYLQVGQLEYGSRGGIIGLGRTRSDAYDSALLESGLSSVVDLEGVVA